MILNKVLQRSQFKINVLVDEMIKRTAVIPNECFKSFKNGRMEMEVLRMEVDPTIPNWKIIWYCI